MIIILEVDNESSITNYNTVHESFNKDKHASNSIASIHWANTTKLTTVTEQHTYENRLNY